jgi:7-cyano-7-deazaguanine reductase
LTGDEEAGAHDPATPSGPLRWRNNPRSGLDFVVALDGALPLAGCRVRLRYVPDRLILDRSAFLDYLATLAPPPDAAPEILALALLDEINNEIVPRWVQIALSAMTGGVSVETIILTDRQPNWDNPEILGALPSL